MTAIGSIRTVRGRVVYIERDLEGLLVTLHVPTPKNGTVLARSELWLADYIAKVRNYAATLRRRLSTPEVANHEPAIDR